MAAPFNTTSRRGSALPAVLVVIILCVVGFFGWKAFESRRAAKREGINSAAEAARRNKIRMAVIRRSKEIRRFPADGVSPRILCQSAEARSVKSPSGQWGKAVGASPVKAQ